MLTVVFSFCRHFAHKKCATNNLNGACMYKNEVDSFGLKLNILSTGNVCSFLTISFAICFKINPFTLTCLLSSQISSPASKSASDTAQRRHPSIYLQQNNGNIKTCFVQVHQSIASRIASFHGNRQWIPAKSSSLLRTQWYCWSNFLPASYYSLISCAI